MGIEEHWFTTRKELDEFLQRRQLESGQELVVDTSDGKQIGAAPTNGKAAQKLLINELHEVRTINAGLAELEKLGFTVDALLAQERTGIETPRYTLRRGESAEGLNDLRSLPAAIRSAGEKGMSVTRFKGLGEMNAEELRETTLDPANRTLMQVTMSNAADADDMFRILMGDKVEPRREFIEKHALEVKNLDV
jgi:DNA gyrase subunit B